MAVPVVSTIRILSMLMFNTYYMVPNGVWCLLWL